VSFSTSKFVRLPCCYYWLYTIRKCGNKSLTGALNTHSKVPLVSKPLKYALTNQVMPYLKIIAAYSKYINTATCRPIAGKHVSAEIDSWKLTRYGTHFHGYEWSTNISTEVLRVVGATKREPRAGGITGPPCSWGIYIQGLGPPGWGSLESETVKCGHESRGTRTWEWLRWRGPAAIVNERPILSSVT
jgi:hypothetical protein